MLPPPSSSAAEASHDLNEHGIALIHGLLNDDELRQARDAVYAGPAEDFAMGRLATRFLLDEAGNVRVWNLLNRGPVFARLAEHPVVLELLVKHIGPNALLGNISANIAQPGSEGGALHADQGGYPAPWPPDPQGINFAWLLDDFTANNGATEVIPGGHLRNQPWVTPEQEPQPVIAPAGTVLAVDGRVWHRTGSNTSQAPRAAIFAWYVRPIYRTQENWFLSLNDEVLQGASENLLTLLGYKTEVLGTVYGRSPK